MSVNGYVKKIEQMQASRCNEIYRSVEQYNSLVSGFLNAEKHLLESIRKLNAWLKSISKEGHLIKLDIKPGRCGHFLTDGPRLRVDGRLMAQAEKGISKTSIASHARESIQLKQLSLASAELSNLLHLSAYYRELGKKIRAAHRCLSVEPWSQRVSLERGFRRFIEDRAIELDEARLKATSLWPTMGKQIILLDDLCFTFNRIGGKWRGYKSLVCSWDVPRAVTSSSNLYCSYLPTFKYIAFNQNGMHITRPINDIPGVSERTDRPTRHVIRSLNQKRFEREIKQVAKEIVEVRESFSDHIYTISRFCESL